MSSVICSPEPALWRASGSAHLLAPCPPAVIGGSQLSWKLWASALESRGYPGGNSEGANLYS